MKHHTTTHGERPCLEPAAYIHLARLSARPAPARPWVEAMKFVALALVPAAMMAGVLWLLLILVLV